MDWAWYDWLCHPIHRFTYVYLSDSEFANEIDERLFDIQTYKNIKLCVTVHEVIFHIIQNLVYVCGNCDFSKYIHKYFIPKDCPKCKPHGYDKDYKKIRRVVDGIVKKYPMLSRNGMPNALLKDLPNFDNLKKNTEQLTVTQIDKFLFGGTMKLLRFESINSTKWVNKYLMITSTNDIINNDVYSLALGIWKIKKSHIIECLIYNIKITQKVCDHFNEFDILVCGDKNCEICKHRDDTPEYRKLIEYELLQLDERLNTYD